MTDPNFTTPPLTPTATPSYQAYQAILDEYIKHVVPLISRVCLALYLFIGISHLFLLQGHVRTILTSIALGSATLYLGTCLRWSKHKPPANRIAAISFLLWVPLWLNSFTHVWLTGELHQATNLFLTLIAGGLFLVWRRWFLIGFVLLLVSWFALAGRFHTSSLLPHYSFSFLFFCALAWITHLAQRKMIRESWALRTRAQTKRQQLEEAMDSLQQEQQHKDKALTELRSYRARMKEILNHAPLVVCLLDLDGQIQMIEGNNAKAFRDQLEEAREQSRLNQRLAPLDPLVVKACRQEEAVGIVHLMERIWNAHLRLVLDERKNPLFLVAVLLDTTERYESQQAREQFVSMVSHELRTPLTAIHGAVRLLANQTGLTPAQHRNMIDMMERNTTRLQRIINDLLDLNKMNLEQLHFVMETTALQPLLLLTIETLSSYAAQSKVSIRLQAPTTGVNVSVDEQRLQQVFTNLLSNALKFSPPDTEIVVEVQLKHNQVYVYVCDQGSGVPEDMQEKIFEPFVQADASSQRAKGGTGLGLNIARRFMHRMEGTIGYEPSEHGARFWFRLPIIP